MPPLGHLKNSGKKEYKACVSQGRFPYLPVLDDILSRENIQTETEYGADASSQAVGSRMSSDRASRKNLCFIFFVLLIEEYIFSGLLNHYFVSFQEIDTVF